MMRENPFISRWRTVMLKRFVWKEGGLASFKLKEDLFTIGQMLKSPYLLFFKVKSSDGKYNPIDLNEAPELFTVPVTRSFLQRRGVEKIKKGVVAKSNPILYEYWIQPRIWYGGDYVWKGGDLVKIDPKVGDLGMDNIVINRDIDPDDKEILEKYELTNVLTDKFLTARLILCLEHGKNIDPLKEKIFFGTDQYGLFG